MQGRFAGIDDNYKHQQACNQLISNPAITTHNSGFESRDSYLASSEPSRGETGVHSVGIEAQYQYQRVEHEIISFGHDRPASSSNSAAQGANDSSAASHWQHRPNPNRPDETPVAHSLNRHPSIDYHPSIDHHPAHTAALAPAAPAAAV
eukprot:CAMPEP_0172151778 /NCGR_PEP_ID=MMETSP1050-20130122/434_1 /TAXON_ID=233186 /ORGANISM="Cryptomonas curvata, Strain CCAP979/52" /LENGTH=148 /DNA_ID=CAMNT_0012819953 /DNA_START=169 /DNA_END=612 /DNA_ORIENTATION=-